MYGYIRQMSLRATVISSSRARFSKSRSLLDWNEMQSGSFYPAESETFYSFNPIFFKSNKIKILLFSYLKKNDFLKKKMYLVSKNDERKRT